MTEVGTLSKNGALLAGAGALASSAIMFECGIRLEKKRSNAVTKMSRDLTRDLEGGLGWTRETLKPDVVYGFKNWKQVERRPATFFEPLISSKYHGAYGALTTHADHGIVADVLRSEIFSFADINPNLTEEERIRIGFEDTAPTDSHIRRFVITKTKDGKVVELSPIYGRVEQKARNLPPGNRYSFRRALPSTRDPLPELVVHAQFQLGAPRTQAEILKTHEHASAIWTQDYEIFKLRKQSGQSGAVQPKLWNTWNDVETFHWQTLENSAKTHPEARIVLADISDIEKQAGKIERSAGKLKFLKYGGGVLAALGGAAIIYDLYRRANDVTASYRKEGLGRKTTKALGEFGISAAEAGTFLLSGPVGIVAGTLASTMIPNIHKQWGMYNDGKKDGWHALGDSFSNPLSFKSA